MEGGRSESEREAEITGEDSQMPGECERESTCITHVHVRCAVYTTKCKCCTSNTSYPQISEAAILYTACTL